MSPKRKPDSSKLPQISDAEWFVMKVVWGGAPVTANQVVKALEGKTDWKPKTVQTLLSRLVAKKALSYEQQGREYLFSPLVRERDYVHAASRSFLGRFFDGELAPFLASFIEREKLSAKEMEELRGLLGRKRSGSRRDDSGSQGERT